VQGMKQSSAAVAEHVATTIFAIVGSRADTSSGASAVVPQWLTSGSTGSAPCVAITGTLPGSDVGTPGGVLEGASRCVPISWTDMLLLASTIASHLRKQAVVTTCTATCTTTCRATCKALVGVSGVRRCGTGCMHVGTRGCITRWNLSVWSDAGPLWCPQGGIRWVAEVRRPRGTHCRLFGAHPGSLLDGPSDVRLRWPCLWATSLQVSRSGACLLVGQLARKVGGQFACYRRSLSLGRTQSHSDVQRATVLHSFEAGLTTFLRGSILSWLHAGVVSASPSRQATCNEVDVGVSQVTALHVGQKAGEVHSELGGQVLIELRGQPVDLTQCNLLFGVSGELFWLSGGSKESLRATRRVVRRSSLTSCLRAGHQAGVLAGLPGFLSVDLSGGSTPVLSASPAEGLRAGRLGSFSVGSMGSHRVTSLKRPTPCQRSCNTTGWMGRKSSADLAGALSCASYGSKEGFRAGRQLVRRSSMAADPRVRPAAGLAGGRRIVLLKRPTHCQ